MRKLLLKNLTRFGLVLLLLLGLALAACGNTQASGDSKTAEPASSTEQVTPGSQHAAVITDAPAHPEIISHGQPIDVADFTAAGQITIFDFMSDYCPPCRRIAPYMEKLHAERDDITVVKVDINRPDVRGIDWRSPVARKYGLNSIPHFKVYGRDGKLMAEGNAATNMVFGWIKELEDNKS